jgi:GTPase Era involved in 16S rRNA processing
MMSQPEEYIQSTLIEDDSLWEKFQNFWKNDYSKFIDDREDQNEKVVRIAVIGKTGAGKGSFINAIRGIGSNSIGSANENEQNADVTHGVLPGPTSVEKYGYPDNENPIIYFYDTGGFGDAYNKTYKLEEELKKYQKENKIKFDAMAFLFDTTRFVKEEIQPLKDQENKVCLVLYIANQIDVLKFKIDNEEKFQEVKGKIKGNYLEVLNKNKVNKHDFCKNNIYLVSSKASKFENEDVSPDGKRIKAELTELLLNIKIGKPLDLFNPFARQLISYKAKFIQDKVSKKACVSAIKTSPIAIFPFADIFMQNKIASNYKDVFLNQFGIKPVIDLITSNKDIENSEHHIMILKGTEKWEKIKSLVDEINPNKIFEAINLIFTNNDKSELTKEKIVALIKQMGLALGGLLASFWDDIAVILGKLAGVTFKISVGVIAAVTLPIAIAIYIKFCHSAIMKVIDELTDYAIKIHNILHE